MRGRPLKYTKEELETLIESYFLETHIYNQTITGLALHLDTSRETLMNYEERDDFFATIKKAKDRIEHAYEMRGLKVGNAFDIFRMKNMGWKDRNETDMNLSGQLGVTINETKTYEQK